MKKKLWIVNLIASLVLVFSLGLSACGKTPNTGNGGNNNDDSQTVAVTSVTLNKSAITLDIDGTETLTATVKPDNATNKTVSWSSDKPEIASVVNGTVTAQKGGAAVITATADGKSATCTVTVNKATVTPPDGEVAVTSVTLNKSAITLDINGTETLTATVKPDNATNNTVSWSSDKPEIASVANGTVTAKAEGTAVITATADGVSATCTVTVNPATVTPPDDTNVLTKIIETCKELAENKGKTNVEILMLFQDKNGYLAFATKSDTGFQCYTTDIEIDATIESVKSVDVSELAKTQLYGYLSSLSFIKGVYTSDGTTIVQEMVTKLLGDGYTVMYGTLTATKDNVVDAQLGANASFTVYALLEKDGNISVYNEMLTVTKDFGDVYQTVLNSTEANKEYRYKSESKTLTDFVDKILYLAEVKNGQQANKYAEIVAALQAKVNADGFKKYGRK